MVSLKVQNAFAQKLDWFAAQDSHIENALCRRNSAASSEEAIAYFQRLDQIQPLESQDLARMSVRGVDFEDERPSLIYAFSLLTSETRLNQQGIYETIYPQKSLHVPASCKKVLCAVQHLFGPRKGPMMLYLMHEYSLNTGPGAFENAGTWSEQELIAVLKALQLVPESLLSSFPLNKKMARVRGLYPEGRSSVLADASMQFFDSWEDASPARKQYIVFHEFAHNFADTISTRTTYFSHDRGEKWLKIFGSTRAHQFVSLYSLTNPAEDFAESLTSYRLTPNLLLKQSPEKYAYLRDYVFAGAEFTSKDKCQPKSKLISEPTLSAESKDKVLRSCGVWIGRDLKYVSTYKTCVNEEGLKEYFVEQGYEPGFFPVNTIDLRTRSVKIQFPRLARELAERRWAEDYSQFRSIQNDVEYQRFIRAL